jgi:hypothetical protein
VRGSHKRRGGVDLVGRSEAEDLAETGADLGIVLGEQAKLGADRAELLADRVRIAPCSRERGETLDDGVELLLNQRV